MRRIGAAISSLRPWNSISLPRDGASIRIFAARGLTKIHIHAPVLAWLSPRKIVKQPVTTPHPLDHLSQGCVWIRRGGNLWHLLRKDYFAAGLLGDVFNEIVEIDDRIEVKNSDIQWIKTQDSGGPIRNHHRAQRRIRIPKNRRRSSGIDQGARLGNVVVSSESDGDISGEHQNNTPSMGLRKLS
jgi:hypothetical protein